MPVLAIRRRYSGGDSVLINKERSSSMERRPWKTWVWVVTGLLFSASILVVGTLLLFRGRQCVDPDIPEGPMRFGTYEQTMFPPGTNCIYHYTDGSTVEIAYPLLTAQWVYLLILLALATAPWLIWWIKFRD